MSFFEELKRRNVFRVGAAYLVLAWLLLQVMDTVGPIIGLSDAFARGVLFLLVAGFPLSLVVSWAFEVTPDGITTQEAVDAGVKTTSGKKLNAVIIGGLVLALVLVVLDSYVLNEPAQTVDVVLSESQAVARDAGDEILQSTAEEKSIAVLPFVNLSGDPTQENFVDGLTEEMINTLSEVSGLLVTGRTSAFFFKNSDMDQVEIADTLGVKHLLQGTVRQSGNQLRISTTLMNVDTGFNLWTETFDRELTDIFSIQDEIADAVSTALSVTLAAGDFDRPGMTRNPDAYYQYLQAITMARDPTPTPERLIDYMDLLERAVEIDPDFGLGWWALRSGYGSASSFMAPEERDNYLALRAEAEANARRVAPDMSVLRYRDKTLLELEALILEDFTDKGSANGELNAGYASFLNTTWRFQEAVAYARRAYRLEPFNLNVINGLGQALLMARQYDEAREILQRGLMLSDFVEGSVMQAALVDLELTVGNLEAALEGTALMRAARDQQTEILQYLIAGDVETARTRIREFVDDPASPRATRLRHLNMLAAIAGDADLALYATENSPGMQTSLWRLNNEFGDGIRSLPKFKELVEQTSLPEYWRASGNWPDYCRPVEGNDDFECF